MNLNLNLALIGALLFAVLPSLVFAQEAVTETVILEPGWNIVSTPKVLNSHSFSVAETADNFDIYVLDASTPTGWATMSDLGQTEFAPLYGYFVNNKTGSDQTLTFDFDTNVEPNDKLFERTFSSEGWYSIGVANDEYAKRYGDDRIDTDNPSKILNLLTGKYDLVIDFTDAVYDSNRKSVVLTDPWKAAVPIDVNELNDLRDMKGYVIYINQSGAKYNGFQNDPVATEELPPELNFSLSADSPDAQNVIVDDQVSTTDVTLLKYIITAENAAVLLKELDIGIETANVGTENVVEGMKLRIDGQVYDGVATSSEGKFADFLVSLDEGVSVQEGENVEIEVLVDIKPLENNFSSGEMIKASVNSEQISSTLATDIDGEIIPASALHGSVEGSKITLFAAGIYVPANSFNSSSQTLGDNDTFGEFVLEFDVSATEDDFYITDQSTSTSNNPTQGVGFTVSGGTIDVITSSLTSTADEDTASVFTVREGETETFTLVVTVDAAAAGTFRVSLDEIHFTDNIGGSTNTEQYDLTPVEDFRTAPKSINQ